VLASAIIILNECDQVCIFTSLFPAFPRSDFMSVLPQITYGNVLILLYFDGYNKNEIFADYWDTQNVF
jgi:hypothetical protein